MNVQLLIVEDDEVVVFLHKKMVVKSGLCTEPLAFLDGKKALDYLTTNYDTDAQFLILLDINMPVMNGWEFLEAIEENENLKQIPVVMVTSSIDKLDKEKAQQYAQVVDFIEKPLFPESCERIKANPQLKDKF